ncbi:MAG: M23 family metallopeptidase [Deltaproteobacteria bacterium]
MNCNLKIIILLFFISAVNVKVYTQASFRIFSEKSGNNLVYYIDNAEYFPLTLKLEMELTNVKILNNRQSYYIIPPLAKKHFLLELAVINPKKPSNSSFSSKVFQGNSSLNDYDREYKYYLPFGKEKTFRVVQGYYGKATHENENCLDFNMPEGTEIYAMREGTVVKIVNSNDRNCYSRSCAKYNNFITIMHSDGTFAEYTHLIKDGNLVNPGDIVAAGQLIGYSGNTGYSQGPHLHVVVYRQKFENRITLVTKFLTGNGEKTEILKENQEYSRNY